MFPPWILSDYLWRGKSHKPLSQIWGQGWGSIRSGDTTKMFDCRAATERNFELWSPTRERNGPISKETPPPIPPPVGRHDKTWIGPDDLRSFRMWAIIPPKLARNSEIYILTARTVWWWLAYSLLYFMLCIPLFTKEKQVVAFLTY